MTNRPVFCSYSHGCQKMHTRLRTFAGCMKIRITYILSALFVVMSMLSSQAQEVNQTDAQGKKQGRWEKLHPNGMLRYEGQFKDDSPTGLFKYYFDTGKLQATNNHGTDGSVASHHYHPNGKLKAKGLYHGQKKDSLWQYFNDNEVLVLEETYKQDMLHGVQRIYFDNGQLGEETHYRDSIKHGAWNKFYPNGNAWIEAHYKDGNLDGSFKIWHEDGKPKVQGNYESGLRTGSWFMYNHNGSVRTLDSYVNGVMKYTRPQNGEFEEFYDSGIPKSVKNYKKGKLNGEFKEWYEKGERVEETRPGTMGGPDEVVERFEGTQLKMKGWYNDDVLNGKVTYYKEDGSTEKVEIWENGEVKSTVDWEEEQE